MKEVVERREGGVSEEGCFRKFWRPVVSVSLLHVESGGGEGMCFEGGFAQP